MVNGDQITDAVLLPTLHVKIAITSTLSHTVASPSARHLIDSEIAVTLQPPENPDNNTPYIHNIHIVLFCIKILLMPNNFK